MGKLPEDKQGVTAGVLTFLRLDHRAKCHVPREVEFKEKWRIALDLMERSQEVPHRWVVGDDEFGRVTAFRAELRLRKETYVLDVPSNTLVREIARRADGKKPAFERADAWAARQPAKRWKTIQVRAGEKGPIQVQALRARVQTKDEAGCVGPTETLVVTRTLDQEKRTSYHVSNAESTEKLWKLAYVGGTRHRVEELLQAGKSEVGMGHYEVRSWVGWHHHMTLSMLALWFLTTERRRLGKKIPALTVPQIREIMIRLLLPTPPSNARIAREISRVLRRTEEARIYHYYAATEKFPPPRGHDVGKGLQ